MKNVLYIIFFLILSFSLNIAIYYISSDYRNFLKNLKNPQEETKTGIILNYDVKISDIGEFKNFRKDNNIENIQEKNIIKKQDQEDKTRPEKKDEKQLKKVEYIALPEELKITKVEEKFLKLFKEYNLKKIELHPRLFDLTAEYPYDYFEYYSEYLTLYFFGNRPYGELKDMFEVLSYEFPFSLNEVNNFGSKSFYINLDEEFNDDIIRIIMQYKNRLFGLKIKKEVYKHIKAKLNSLKSN